MSTSQTPLINGIAPYTYGRDGSSFPELAGTHEAGPGDERYFEVVMAVDNVLSVHDDVVGMAEKTIGEIVSGTDVIGTGGGVVKEYVPVSNNVSSNEEATVKRSQPEVREISGTSASGLDEAALLAKITAIHEGRHTQDNTAAADEQFALAA